MNQKESKSEVGFDPCYPSHNNGRTHRCAAACAGVQVLDSGPPTAGHQGGFSEPPDLAFVLDKIRFRKAQTQGV